MIKLKALLKKVASKHPRDLSSHEDLEAHFENFISNELLKSETLQEAFSLSTYELEEVYHEAYYAYQENSYLESATTFRWLLLFNPYEAKYWLGLAASLQLLEKYEKALHAYALSALLESGNPYPHFHAYECYLQLHNPEEGKKALELAYRRSQENPIYKGLQKQIESLHSGALWKSQS